MKERPILFSAPMVRALLDGRKTQTRRIVKNSKWETENPECGVNRPPCPYGVAGDRLWVRETWAPEQYDVRAETPSAIEESSRRPAYRADYNGQPAYVWKPSIHMPRWASRINLEIASVRVERLQDISEADAIAEGVKRAGECGNGPIYHPSDSHVGTPTCNPIYAYGQLWEQINGREGPNSWAANPWVWIVEFRSID
jgi:hypothetical protein